MAVRSPTRAVKRRGETKKTRPSPKSAKPRLPRKVQAALEEFQRRALELFPDDILQIILYGSYARGEATPDSDVDVMVVGSWTDHTGADPFYSPGPGDPPWEQLVDVAATIDGPFISVLLKSEREFNTNLPVVRDAKQEGIVLWQREGWVMSTEEEVHPADPYSPQTWLTMAEMKLEKAHKFFDAGWGVDAISPAYYAMFYATRAALLTKGLYLKKHSAAADQFRQMFVFTGEVEERYLTYLSSAQTAREKSDYEPYAPLPPDKPTEVLEAAVEFIARVKELIHQRGGDRPREDA